MSPLCHPLFVLTVIAIHVIVHSQQEELFYSFGFEEPSDWIEDIGSWNQEAYIPVEWEQGATRCPRAKAGGTSQYDKSCVRVVYDAFISRTISTVGYHTIRLQIDANPQGVDQAENEWCFVQYRTSTTSWQNTNVAQGVGDYELDFPITIPNTNVYNNQPSFQVKIGIAADAGGDNCYFDNLKIFGIPYMPTENPTFNPTIHPSVYPTTRPSLNPSVNPTTGPSLNPSIQPTTSPTANPFSTQHPSIIPSANPTSVPSVIPTEAPSVIPSVIPTVIPSVIPTEIPSVAPTDHDNDALSASSNPTTRPSFDTTTDLRISSTKIMDDDNDAISATGNNENNLFFTLLGVAIGVVGICTLLLIIGCVYNYGIKTEEKEQIEQMVSSVVKAEDVSNDSKRIIKVFRSKCTDCGQTKEGGEVDGSFYCMICKQHLFEVDHGIELMYDNNVGSQTKDSNTNHLSVTTNGSKPKKKESLSAYVAEGMRTCDTCSITINCGTADETNGIFECDERFYCTKCWNNANIYSSDNSTSSSSDIFDVGNATNVGSNEMNGNETMD